MAYSADYRKAVEEKPDAYLRELSKQFNCSTTAIYNRLVQIGFAYYSPNSNLIEKTWANIKRALIDSIPDCADA
jgi:hypothetical protein